MPATNLLAADVPVLALTVQATSVLLLLIKSSPADDWAVLPLTVQLVSVIVPRKLNAAPPKEDAELPDRVQSVSEVVPVL